MNVLHRQHIQYILLMHPELIKKKKTHTITINKYIEKASGKICKPSLALLLMPLC